MVANKKSSFNPKFEQLEDRELLAFDLTTSFVPVSLVNGGFETGLDSWETLGDVSTGNASFGENPTSGENQGLLSNRNGAGGDVTDSSLEDFLKLDPGALDKVHAANASSTRQETALR